MSSLVLEKGFGTFFDNDEFNEDKMRYLMVKVRTNTGDIVKKKGKVNERFMVQNIKSLEEAHYGYSNEESYDVTEEVSKIVAKQRILNKIYNLNERFLVFIKEFAKILSSNDKKTREINHAIINADNLSMETITVSIFKSYVAYVINTDKDVINKKHEKMSEVYSDILVNTDHHQSEHFDIVNTIFTSLIQRGNIDVSMKEQSEFIITNTFKYLFPCLNYFFYNSGTPFIRFNIKSKKMVEGNKFPAYTEEAIHVITNKNNERIPTTFPAYEVQVDKMPSLSLDTTSGSGAMGIKGYIPINRFKQMGGKVHMPYDSKTPNSLFAESNIDISKWAFTYTSEKLTEKDVKKTIAFLTSQEIPICDRSVLLKFSLVVEILTNKFILLH
jgi:hypothetical protein